MKWETNDKLAQQCLVVVNGDKVPQQTHLGNLCLRAIIRANDETGIVWGEQVLRTIQLSDEPEIAHGRTEAVCEMERM